MANRLPVEVVGVSHVAGKYHFTDADFLNEGAEALHELGCQIIKVWFTNLARSYPFNSHWPACKTLVETAKVSYFQTLFDKPFDTILLETFAPSRKDDYWLAGISADDVKRERDEMQAFATHLFDAYKQSGKTFVIQNWEGDWALRGGAPGNDPKPQSVKGMIDWLNARQEGVDAARKSAADAGVRVLHAAEVNHLDRAMKKQGATVTNDVLPQTHCDLYSYSAWDLPTHEPEKFRAALDYLASKAPGGKEKIYVGEYGAPENVVGGADEQDRRVRSATQTAIDWGAKYIVYWQLYCNEPKDAAKITARPKNEDMRGFWLVRPDGSRPPATDYFIELWNRR